MRAMILAAGRGERLRPLTDRLPKPLLRLAGKTLLEHHIARLRAAGIHELVINLSWLGERIRAQIGTGAAHGVYVEYSQEPAAPLETGGGILQALPLLGDGPFVVVNGDTYADIDLAQLRLAPNDLAGLVMVANPEHHPKGDFALADGRLTRAESERLTFTGTAIYRPELFASGAAGRFPLAPLLRDAIDAGRAAGWRHEGIWFDLGTPQRLAAAHRALALAND